MVASQLGMSLEFEWDLTKAAEIRLPFRNEREGVEKEKKK